MILLYVGSVGYVYNWFRIAYSKGGRWENSHPIPMDIFITFCPLLNTATTLLCFFLSPKDKPAGFNIDKFFRIKK